MNTTKERRRESSLNTSLSKDDTATFEEEQNPQSVLAFYIAACKI